MNIMPRDEVLEALCTWDRRSPYYADLKLAYEDDPGSMPRPRKSCSCDNCFYGRDRLALEILRLKSNVNHDN